MRNLGGVSERTEQIYLRHYSDREQKRFANLYTVFDRLAILVDGAQVGARIAIDVDVLGEVVRSYFLDVIRYKEYHFDPDPDAIKKSDEGYYVWGQAENSEFIDPLSEKWTELVHRGVNINGNKVAAYTAKWILKFKPISVLTNSEADVNNIKSIPNQSHILNFINEYYALYCVLAALEIDAKLIDPRKIEELIYTFRFRNFEEKSFFMILSEDYLLSGSHG